MLEKLRKIHYYAIAGISISVACVTLLFTDYVINHKDLQESILTLSVWAGGITIPICLGILIEWVSQTNLGKTTGNAISNIFITIGLIIKALIKLIIALALIAGVIAAVIYFPLQTIAIVLILILLTIASR